MTKSNNLRHVIVFLLILIGIYIAMTYTSKLDNLREVPSFYSKDNAGIKEMEIAPGMLEPHAYAVPGNYTILYFYSDSCPTCRRLHPGLLQFVDVRPDVAVLKFNLGYDWSGDEAYNNYKLRIGKTPFIHIYDPLGKPVAVDAGYESEGLDLLYAWMRAELYEAWK